MMEKSEAVLAFIRAYTAEHGHSPSRREIQVGVGLSSTSVAQYLLKALQRAGRVKIMDDPCPACGGTRRQRLAVIEKNTRKEE